jgi:hypothetical protein
MTSSYIFAKNDLFLAYVNNFNHYVVIIETPISMVEFHWGNDYSIYDFNQNNR